MSKPNQTQSPGLTQDFAHFLRGACMGAADVVPGVSGGTVALVLGIYQRLIKAISCFDVAAVRMLVNKQYKEAANHIDLRFIAALAIGIASGFVITIKTLSHYLENDSTRSFVMAAFCGMIIAASIVVLRMILKLENRSAVANWSAVVVGIAVAGIISQMRPSQVDTGDPALWYLFVCGAFAICAMILPGISGALILVLFGVYQHLVHVAKAVLHFEDLASNLLKSIVFATGCAIGLGLFSRILRRLLDQRPGETLSMLCGLIIGSLPLLWPFQINTTPDVEEAKLRIYKPYFPEALDTRFWQHAGVFVSALVIVLAVELIASKLSDGESRI